MNNGDNITQAHHHIMKHTCSQETKKKLRLLGAHNRSASRTSSDRHNGAENVQNPNHTQNSSLKLEQQLFDCKKKLQTNLTSKQESKEAVCLDGRKCLMPYMQRRACTQPSKRIQKDLLQLLLLCRTDKLPASRQLGTGQCLSLGIACVSRRQLDEYQR